VIHEALRMLALLARLLVEVAGESLQVAIEAPGGERRVGMRAIAASS
jgi:hypothetical protein